MFGKFIYTFYIFFFIDFIWQAKTLELTQHDEKRNEKLSYRSTNGKLTDNYENTHYCISASTECRIVKKIQYYPCSTNPNSCALDINFNSACIRCEICLSIVDQINHTLTYIHKRISPIVHLNDTQVKSLFKIICEYAFTNYGMRNVEGHRVIFDRISDANLIVTNVDGQWNDHLKMRCLELIDNMGALKVFKHWKIWWHDGKIITESTNLEEILCRDQSTFFRDCKGISLTRRMTCKNTENERLRNELFDLIK